MFVDLTQNVFEIHDRYYVTGMILKAEVFKNRKTNFGYLAKVS